MISLRLDSEDENYLRGLASQEERTLNNVIARMVREHSRYHPLLANAPELVLKRGEALNAFKLVQEGKEVGHLHLKGGCVIKLDIQELNVESEAHGS